jgi:hypothetical protein
LYGKGLTFYEFHEVHEEGLKGDTRHWIVTFHDETLDVRAERAEVVLRAVQAQNAASALAAVRT